MDTAGNRAPVYGIDVMRFLAASAVMLYHFSAKPFLTPEATTLKAVMAGLPPRDAPAGAVWWGWIGVQVFFVISGVVISYSAARATPRSFFVGRVARLWPAMLICTVIIAALNLVWWDHGLVKEAGLVIRSLIFWPPGPWVSGQIWTLPIEIAFYGLVWLLVLGGRADRLEALAWVLGVMSCAWWLAQAAGYVAPHGIFAWLLFQHGLYFALGVTIMAAGVNGPTPARVLLALLCCGGAWLEIGYLAAREGGGLAFPAAAPFLLWLAACLFIWLSVALREPVARRVERAPGAARALRTLGMITYPLYLVHLQPGGLVLTGLLARGVPTWPAVLAGCLVAIALALAIALLFEPPVHGAVKRWLTRLLDRADRRRNPEGLPAA